VLKMKTKRFALTVFLATTLMACATFNAQCRSRYNTQNGLISLSPKLVCSKESPVKRKATKKKQCRKSNVKPRPISVKGYKGFADLQKGIMYLNLGDIAGVYNEIDIPAIAEAAFKEYPQCKVCRMRFEVVAFNRQTEYKAVFRNTPQGVLRK